jgi:hypothetical protein
MSFSDLLDTGLREIVADHVLLGSRLESTRAHFTEARWLRQLPQFLPIASTGSTRAALQAGMPLANKTTTTSRTAMPM